MLALGLAWLVDFGDVLVSEHPLAATSAAAMKWATATCPDR